MNGADALLAGLSANGVTTCFANPGTTEMYVVAALEDSDVTAVLCLFEGVATGAADGYARVTGAPAATLLHLGPGLGNGWANLHNARRAHSPVVNLVGNHSTSHLGLDSMLESDLTNLAASLGGWYANVDSAQGAAEWAARASVEAHGPPGRSATLSLAADAMWETLEAAPNVTAKPLSAPPDVDETLLGKARAVLGPRTGILLGGRVGTTALDAAGRISAATGTRVLLETMPAFVARGRGLFHPERVIYVPEFAIAQLAELEHLVLVGAPEPVAAFAYPGLPGRLREPESDLVRLCAPGVDPTASLLALAESIDAPQRPSVFASALEVPRGELNAQSLALAVAATLPEGAIVVDESNTSGIHIDASCASAPTHHWMGLTGASIGYALPAAVGAAVASRGRVLALESDGSMFYTLQALWTMARESLDVTVLALANGRYAVLDMERKRLGAQDAESEHLFDLGRPSIDLAGLARSFGVPASVVHTADELVQALSASYATPGPSFIEARLPSSL